MSFEGKENEYLAQELYEAKQKLREKQKEELSKLQGVSWKKCVICGFEPKTLNEAKVHYSTEHEKQYGVPFETFLKVFKSHVKQLSNRISSEEEKGALKRVELQLFMKSLREGYPRSKDQLARIGKILASKEFESLYQSINTQKSCPCCGATEPLLDEEGKPTNETILSHMERLHPEDFQRYLDLGIIHYENKIPESYEEKSKEQLSKSLKEEKLKETVEKIDPLLLAFGDEVTEKLSKEKKKQRGRKTR